MLTKICGIQTEADALAATKSGADLLGFVFADSKRQVTVEQVQRIKAGLSSQVQTVGVFVNLPITQINQVASLIGLDYVQLHGQESVEQCKASLKPVIKAFSINSRQDLEQVKDYLPYVAYVLLDGSKAGSGQTFDWRLIDAFDAIKDCFILAGGLNPENVKSAITYTSPIGVDVSSGVETNGIKDPNKIQDFITNAKKVR
ncbi:phosphoribosylanthranilate isomerase [Amphibacillus sediminis]|uniref:phosphoribosylanthranilate isomerase n=1 Tax=Amphibacillus sediminis TaxID=360185 RepID=UPI00082FCF60|nr:phosphoribosylanthranilate isomerase [Amphibacillus sediminis]